MEKNLIIGLQFDVPSHEMKTLLERAAAQQREKVAEYERFIEQIDVHVQPAHLPPVEVPATLRSPFGLGGLPQHMGRAARGEDDALRESALAQIAKHSAAAERLEFLASHIIPDVVYRVGGGIGGAFFQAAQVDLLHHGDYNDGQLSLGIL